MDEQTAQSRSVCDQLFREWDGRAALYSKVAYGAMLAKNSDGWRSVLTFFVPLARGSHPQARRLEYRDLIITSGSLDLEDAKNVILQVLDRGHLSLPDAPECALQATLGPNGVRRWGSQHRRYTLAHAATEYQFSISDSERAAVPWGYLCSPDLPLYPHAYAAIQDVLGVTCVNQGARQSELVALAPDYRAKVEYVRLTTFGISVEISIANLSEGPVIGKLYHEDGTGQNRYDDLAFVNGVATVPTTGQPRRVLVALISSVDGDVIDEWSYDAFHPGPNGPVIEVTGEDLEHLIASGESDTLEFKREVPAALDLAVGISAFANTTGGRIMIGVDNNAEVVGCDNSKINDRFTNILRDHCTPTPSFTIRSQTFRDKNVVIISVPEGPDKPYMTEKGAYIRAGATNRRITRYELDQLYAARQAPQVWPQS